MIEGLPSLEIFAKGKAEGRAEAIAEAITEERKNTERERRRADAAEAEVQRLRKELEALKSAR